MRTQLRYLIAILFFGVGSLLAADESESLTCSAESSPDEFNEMGGTGCAIVEDASDATYYETLADFNRQRWTIDNTTATWTTIDSVVVDWRHGGKGAKVQQHAIDIFVATDSTMGALLDYGDATIRDSSASFILAPDGGSWTTTDVNGLEVQGRSGDIAGGGGWLIYEYGVTVWGTQEAVDGQAQGIIIIKDN